MTTSFLNKRSGTQFYHDWKPMQSMIDMLHKNFQEDHTNSRRFPGFPGVVDTLQKHAKIAPIRRVSFHFTEFHFPKFQVTDA